MEPRTIRITWRTSRGIDTYGYTVCSLFYEGERIATTKGGGYDLKGTVFGDFILDTYPEQLKRLCSENYSGLKFYTVGKGNCIVNHAYWIPGCTICLDGACGWYSMIKIYKAIGFRLIPVHSSTNEEIYLSVDNPPEVVVPGTYRIKNCLNGGNYAVRNKA